MSNKTLKMWGTPVSNEEVIAALGRPSAEWERNSRRHDFQSKLRRGQTDLDIGGIIGYGSIDGYLTYLERALVRPLGVGTGLVSEEENAQIRQELEIETRAEIEKYRRRLVELEQSPEEVANFIATMKWWLDYSIKQQATPDPSVDEEFDAMMRRGREKDARDIEYLEFSIDAYVRHLESLTQPR